MRKAEEYKKKSLIHPALLPDWDDLSRDEQSDKLLKWTILTRKNSIYFWRSIIVFINEIIFSY